MRPGANLRPGVCLFPGGRVILYGKSWSQQRWLAAHATLSTWGRSWQPGTFLDEQAGERVAGIMSELEEAELDRSGGRGPLLAAASSSSSCNMESVDAAASD